MSVRKSLAWSYGGQAFVFLVTFGSSVIVARILGPYEMGVFAIAMATAGVLSVLSSFGVGPYLVRHETLDAATTSTVFTVNAIINLIISAAMLVTVLVGSQFDLNDKVRQVLLVIAIAPLIGIFEFMPSTLLQREMRFRAIALIGMGRVVVTSGTVVAFALAGFGSVSPALAIVAAALYGAVIVNLVGWRYATFRPGLSGWRDITRFGLHMMTIGGVATVAQRFCEIALGRILGLTALGVYVRASSLADQVWYNVYGQATRVIFTKMAEEMRETGTLAKTFLGGISMITALIWPVLAGLAVLSGPVIHALYGERWIGAAVPLSLLMVVHFIGLGFGMNWELCILTKKTGWQARVEVLKATVGSIAFIAGSFAGLAGAAAGRVVEALTGLVIYAPRMREMAGTRPGEIAKVFRESAILTIAAVGPSVAVMLSNRWSPATSWWLIGPAILVGIVLWLAMLRAYRHPLLDEILRALSRIMPRARAQNG